MPWKEEKTREIEEKIHVGGRNDETTRKEGKETQLIKEMEIQERQKRRNDVSRRNEEEIQKVDKASEESHMEKRKTITWNDEKRKK